MRRGVYLEEGVGSYCRCEGFEDFMCWESSCDRVVRHCGVPRLYFPSHRLFFRFHITHSVPVPGQGVSGISLLGEFLWLVSSGWHCSHLPPLRVSRTLFTLSRDTYFVHSPVEEFLDKSVGFVLRCRGLVLFCWGSFILSIFHGSRPCAVWSQPSGDVHDFHMWDPLFMLLGEVHRHSETLILG